MPCITAPISKGIKPSTKPEQIKDIDNFTKNSIVIIINTPKLNP